MANSCNKLMKEAINVAVNEFRGIEFTYKLDDVLDSLSPNQKFSSNQLKGYLLKQGVSPNEIRASKMFEGFENDNRALAISDWKNASLGLGGLASQSEAAEPISTTSGIAPRETNSMMETMRLEGQPNIFRLQDLATGRTQVSKAKPNEKEILNYFSQKESKGDYNAKSSISSAYGKYQFLKDTLAEKARLHGMTVKEARTPQGQEELMRKVLKDYEARLRKFDLPITKENLFVVHNLGETGGIRAIRGTYTPEDVERMRNNIPGTQKERNSLSKSEVVKEYYKMHKVTKGS